ncbi:MAG: NADP-dependent malic enzyme [Sneathiellaceae bacterium]
MAQDLDSRALAYHREPRPGKISVTPTKPLGTQADLSLAYSPGVAAACLAIRDDPLMAAQYTIRGNLVGVVSNGTAVLGLGNIGPLASKPVMEGKGVLFKKFAGIDVFDIELAETDADRLVDAICALEPTFGAINLEDIKAPECFIVERKCKERMNIPVMHDDQHGTAICVGAAAINGLRVVGKRIEEIRLVCTGAGAAALACLDMLVVLGMRRENITVVDLAGVVYEGRTELMDPFKARYARDTPWRSLGEAIEGADMFLGLSGPDILKPEMVKRMAERPLILALANPSPEIMPDLAKDARPDAVIATGRSDFPNQVNNLLCFPFLFRGALDVGATAINEEMKKAAVMAIAGLALVETSDEVATAYGIERELQFGPEYLIPKPFDPRLIVKVSSAVAQAAMDSGVATRPIEDMAAYRRTLGEYVYKTGFVMKPVFERARARPVRVAYAEGEEWRVLHAVQVVLDEGLAQPILIGRRSVVESRIAKLNLRMRLDDEVQLIDPQDDPQYDDYWRDYHSIMARKGTDPDMARYAIRTNPTLIGAMMVRRDDADSLICGTFGQHHRHLRRLVDIIGLRPNVHRASCMQVLVVPGRGTIFIADTNVALDPTAEEIFELTLLAADHVSYFGITPKIALLSHSNFGSSDDGSSVKMRQATALLHRHAAHLEVDGEMKGDSALSEAIRRKLFPETRLSGSANLLIMPNVDAANIAVNLIRQLTDGITVGPVLMGLQKSVHAVTPSITARGLVNMTALAAVRAQDHCDGKVGPLLPAVHAAE